MIHARSIPQGAMVKVNSTAKPCATVSGSFNANKTVELRDGLFPEFDRHRRIYGKTVIVLTTLSLVATFWMNWEL